MSLVLPVLVGLFISAGIYLMLSRALIRVVLGFVLLGNGVNLLILVAGRVGQFAPPIIAAGRVVPAAPMANPLPQAFILTAIVIGFAFFAFLAVLVMRAYQSFDADNSEHMRLSEPPGTPHPPLDY